MSCRKWVLIAIAALVIPATAFSFDFHFGFKAGLGFPFAGGKGWDEALVLPAGKSKIVTFGFPGGIPPIMFCMTAGFFTTFGLMPSFAIQPEIFYTMLAQHGEGSTQSYYQHWAVIEVPILAKLRLMAENGAGIALFGGPDVMYVLAQQVIKDDRSTSGIDYDSGIKWNTGDILAAPLIFGVVAGLAVHFPEGFFIEGRYFISFFKANKDYDWASLTLNSFDPSNRTWLQNNIQVLLGYQF
jgi:hypothetical protein